MSKQVGSREQSHFPEVARFMGFGLRDVAEKNLETKQVLNITLRYLYLFPKPELCGANETLKLADKVVFTCLCILKLHV